MSTSSPFISRSLAILLLAGLLGTPACNSDDFFDGLNLEFLNVRTRTSGMNPDSDGYLVRILGPSTNESERLGINDRRTFLLDTQGSFEVSLQEISPNCSVTGNPRTVNVPRRGNIETTFEIVCV